MVRDKYQKTENQAKGFWTEKRNKYISDHTSSEVNNLAITVRLLPANAIKETDMAKIIL